MTTTGVDVTVAGSRFETSTVDNVTSINGRAARVVSATSSSLTVSVPLHAGSGPLTVRTPAGLTTGPDLLIPPPGTQASDVQ